jgi:hypothetical protein
MNKLFSILPALFLTTGCCAIGAEAEVSAHATMHFDPPTAALNLHISCDQVPVLSTSASSSFDVSDVFQQVQKQGSLTVKFDESSLVATEGSLSPFKYAEVYAFNNGETPELLAKTGFNADANGKVEVPIVMDGGRLVQILSAGKVNVQTMLETCIVSSPIVVDYTLGANLNLSANKSL